MKMGSLGQKKIEQAVVKILSDSLAQTDRLIEDDSRLVEDLYVDSIVLVEVVMELNKNFGVELPESEIAGWKTVRDICCSLGCSTGDLKFQM
ncbi:acyl carrier protein [Pseudomonas kilonensis]|uniref:acyl carrier protein n=1 Tax=Pseudomonas kilonensis TaxID=132476 RepID=UPI000463FF0D|nr:acyl carrier protein [Pseudomonas kilonensis]